MFCPCDFTLNEQWKVLITMIGIILSDKFTLEYKCLYLLTKYPKLVKYTGKALKSIVCIILCSTLCPLDIFIYLSEIFYLFIKVFVVFLVVMNMSQIQTSY